MKLVLSCFWDILNYNSSKKSIVEVQAIYEQKLAAKSQQ